MALPVIIALFFIIITAILVFKMKSYFRLVMEENEQQTRTDTSSDQARIQNNHVKLLNGEITHRVQTTKKRGTFTHKNSPNSSDTGLQGEEPDSHCSGDYSEACYAATLRDNTKLKNARLNLRHSHVEIKTVTKNDRHDDDDGVMEREEGGEKGQEIQKIKAELKDLPTNLVVNLPPEQDEVDEVCSKNPLVKKESINDKQPKGLDSKENLTTNKDSEEQKDDNPCIVDCLYYSMQCCDCSIM